MRPAVCVVLCALSLVGGALPSAEADRGSGGAGAPATPPSGTPSPAPRRLGDRRFVIDGVSARGMRPRRVTIVLPSAYARQPARRFPVVYAHDGQVALEGGLEIPRAIEALVRERAIGPWIVVAVDSTGQRTAELTAQVEGTSTLVLEVVKGLVDAHFRTRPGPDDTALVGYSFGGLSTLRIALRHRELLGRAVCMSSSFWWADKRALRELARHRGRMPHRLWIDVGLREPGGRPVPYMVADARRARDLAIGKGMTLGRDLGYLEEPGAQHGFAWGGLRIKRALAFALR